MQDVGLRIVRIQRDPLASERMRTGKYRINHELNLEWVDIANQGPYVLNLQERVLACVSKQGSRLEVLRSARILAHQAIPFNPGQTVRIYTGEQPRTATYIDDSERVHRVLWLVQRTYLWVPQGTEARLYFSRDALKQLQAPLARYPLA